MSVGGRNESRQLARCWWDSRYDFKIMRAVRGWVGVSAFGNGAVFAETYKAKAFDWVKRGKCFYTPKIFSREALLVERAGRVVKRPKVTRALNKATGKLEDLWRFEGHVLRQVGSGKRWAAERDVSISSSNGMTKGENATPRNKNRHFKPFRQRAGVCGQSDEAPRNVFPLFSPSFFSMRSLQYALRHNFYENTSFLLKILKHFIFWPFKGVETTAFPRLHPFSTDLCAQYN